MLMSAQLPIIHVMSMPAVLTLMVVTSVIASLASVVMGLIAQVSALAIHYKPS